MTRFRMTGKHEANAREVTLSLLLRHGASKASSLASSRGISVQAMRKHLRTLELEGYVVSTPAAYGTGRPSNLWQLTTKGKNLFNNGFGSEQFALQLMDSLDESLSKEMFAQLLETQSNQKAELYKRFIGKGSLNLRLEKLLELRNAEGYMSELHPLKDGSSSWVLNAFHCSIHSIAEKYPIVCDQELQLIRSIFEDCQVKRIQWRIESGHSCGFEITPKKTYA